MKLHLPKALATALAIVASLPAALADNYVLDASSTSSVTLGGNGGYDRLVFDSTLAQGVHTFREDIAVTGDHWAGSGSATDAAKHDNSQYIKLTGVISGGSGTLKFNAYPKTAGKNVVWELSGANTYAGNLQVNFGGDPNSYAQLTLASAVTTYGIADIANGKAILHLAADVTLKGLTGNGAVTANQTGRTLTLNVGSECTFSGSLGGGRYLTTDNYATVENGNIGNQGTAGTTLNLVKQGAAKQTLSGTVQVGSLTVENGTLALAAGSTTTASGISVTGGALEVSGVLKTSETATISVTGGALKVSGALKISATEAISVTGGGSLTVMNGGSIRRQLAGTALDTNTISFNEGSFIGYYGSGTLDFGTIQSVNNSLELAAVSGTLAGNAGEVTVVSQNIKLTNDNAAAAEFTEVQGSSYRFTGKMLGGGNMAFNVGSSVTKTLEFTGDLSGWQSGSGNYDGLRAVTGTLDVTLSGTVTNKTVANAFVESDSSGANNASQAMNLTIDRDAKLTNTLIVTNLTIGAGKRVELSNQVSVTVGEKTTIGQGGTLVISRTGSDRNYGTVAGAGTVESSVDTRLTLGNTLGSEFNGSLKATANTLRASGVTQLAAVSAVGGNVELTATADTAIYLQSLTIQGGSRVTATSVSMGSTAPTPLAEESPALPTLTVQAGEGDATFDGDLTLGSTAVTLRQELKVTGSLTLGTGNTLVLSEALKAALPTGVVLFTGTLTGGFDFSAPVAASSVFSSINGETDLHNYALSYNTDTHALTLTAPEPATATLSLLALAGLAARRRRKG